MGNIFVLAFGTYGKCGHPCTARHEQVGLTCERGFNAARSRVSCTCIQLRKEELPIDFCTVCCCVGLSAARTCLFKIKRYTLFWENLQKAQLQILRNSLPFQVHK